MLKNLDLIESIVNSCGCEYTLTLDIVENIVSEHFIKICKTHFKTKLHKQTYVLNKQLNVYECKTFKTTSQNRIKARRLSNSISPDAKTLNFGKYKHRTFDYVYNKDKTYCYNLSFWNKKANAGDSNLNEFINYVRNAISTF